MRDRNANAAATRLGDADKEIRRGVLIGLARPVASGTCCKNSSGHSHWREVEPRLLEALGEGKQEGNREPQVHATFPVEAGAGRPHVER